MDGSVLFGKTLKRREANMGQYFVKLRAWKA